jgi:hypothetical protein
MSFEVCVLERNEGRAGGEELSARAGKDVLTRVGIIG